MNQQLTQLLLSVCAPALAGVAVLRALGIRWRDDRLAFTGWAWLAGTLLMAALTLAWLTLEKPIAGSWLAPVLALAGAAALVRVRPRHGSSAAPERARGEERLFHASIAALLVLAACAIVAAPAYPAMVGDEASIWAAKAKAWYGAHDWNELRRDLSVRTCHADYPMLNPLLQVWMFAGAGEILLFHARLPIQLCTVAMLCVLASLLRRTMRPFAGAAVLLLFFTQRALLDDLDHANSDLMVVFGVIATLDAWLRVRAGDPRCWPIACAGLAVLAWSKNEGMALALLIGLWLAHDVRRRGLLGSPRAMLWLLLPGAALATTAVLTIALHVTNDIVPWNDPGQFLHRLQTNVARGVQAVELLTGYMLATQSRWLLVAFLGTALLFPRRLRRTAAAPIVITVLGALLLYVGALAGSPHDLDWHVATAGPRLLLQVSAVATVGLAIAIPILCPALGPKPTR